MLDEGQPALEPKIAGGTLAEQGDFPWYISPTLAYFCGASLIHELSIISILLFECLFS